jgi:hypothetical protein
MEKESEKAMEKYLIIKKKKSLNEKKKIIFDSAGIYIFLFKINK